MARARRAPRGRGGRGLIRLVVVGRARGALAEAAAIYEERVGRALRLDVVEVREEPLQRGTTVEVQAREAERIRRACDGWPYVLLDPAGRLVDSEGLAELVRAREEAPPQRTAFVIGGASGLDPALRGDAVEALSLGRITLPHQLARVVLAEQLYRATTIIRGEPYHR